MLVTRLFFAGFAMALAAAFTSMPVFAQDATPPTDAIRAKAEQIVSKFTPDKSVWVRGFRSGLHVIGVTLPKPAAAAGPAASAQVDVALPDWYPKAQLLGALPRADEILVRLLWNVEPRLSPLPAKQGFTLRLANHQGYGQQTQQGERSEVSPASLEFGTAFWTDHRIPSLAAYPPGLYDVILSTVNPPQEVIPLGQAVYSGQVVETDDIRKHMQTLLPGSSTVLAGSAVLARWTRLRVPVSDTAFTPHTLAVVSSVDWLEDTGNLTPIATITVKAKGGASQSLSILLGRDTASTWYGLHVRANVRHEQAPIAWSWNERQDTVDFEASLYLAKYALKDVGGPVESIEINYTHPKGVLRIRGLSLLP